MTLVLDAGAFLAVEAGDRAMVALIKSELVRRCAPVTHGGVIAQVWRGGAGKQASVARLLPGVEVVPVDASLGKRAGVLIGRAGTSDAVDAALVCLAADGETIVTTDPRDLRQLAEAADLHVDLVPA